MLNGVWETIRRQKEKRGDEVDVCPCAALEAFYTIITICQLDAHLSIMAFSWSAQELFLDTAGWIVEGISVHLVLAPNSSPSYFVLFVFPNPLIGSARRRAGLVQLHCAGMPPRCCRREARTQLVVQGDAAHWHPQR